MHVNETLEGAILIVPMAFVDLAKDKLVLKVILAGPPAVGKTERLFHIGDSGGRREKFGTTVTGITYMAALPLTSEREGREVEIEVYEWHGPEKADVRARGIFIGIDGLIYLADAREDRYVDTIRQFEFLVSQVGRSRLVRLPALLVLGRMDEGLLRLSSLEGKLDGPTWSDRLEIPYDDAERFVEAVRVYGEVMLARTL